MEKEKDAIQKEHDKTISSLHSDFKVEHDRLMKQKDKEIEKLNFELNKV